MKTILLIDDNADLLDNLSEYLGMEGYKTIITNTGKKGIESAQKFIPDLIICDVLMPEMNGLDVFRLLLNTNYFPVIPFIFSTSVAEKFNKKEALDLGADGYIIKPFELETLLETIKECIRSGSKRGSYALKEVR
jgi:DNA-binding response OmpR family regulator